MRVGKVLMVLALGLFMVLAAFNNVLTWGGAFSADGAVAMTIGMQETGQHPNLMWRAIDSPIIVALGAIGIILVEIAAGVLALWGALNMWKARANSAADFHASKEKGLLGLSVMAVLYLLGFQAVAGEWFMVWQTPAPTILAAFINLAMALLVMLWVNTKDD
jgi:predicted small integral membrane protein